MFSLSPCPTTPSFEKVDFESLLSLDYHGRYWWRSSGHALAILLDKAGYTDQQQFNHLKIIQAITPYLGAAPLPGRPRHWKSFMTDNHIPIEISWDWGTGDEIPMVRLSIEPVGVHAGTPIDPSNGFAAADLRNTMSRLLPNTNMKWLDHFRQALDTETTQESVEGHSTKEFYAFDLDGDRVDSKAYFFPGYKAEKTGRSNFSVIEEAIQTAPGCVPESLEAWNLFREYVQDPSTPQLEMDMLSIDLKESAQSRFKIYFRIRDTSFASVKDAVTMGNRIQLPEFVQGMPRLQSLYNSVLNSENVADDEQLPSRDHRTGGILYYMSFKYGSKVPKVKVYLPVRHHATSEQAVISGVAASLDNTKPRALRSISNFQDAMQMLYSSKTLKSRSGVHTYIGVSIAKCGNLSMISYINPH